MECKQLHYFFIILGEVSWGHFNRNCERMIIGNCITAKVKPLRDSPLLPKSYENIMKQPLLVLQIQKT